MADTQKVTVRFPVKVIEDIEEIQRKYNYKNVSAVLKDAAREFVMLKKSTPGESRFVIALPVGSVETMKDLIRIGDFRTEEDIIKMAVREYLDRRIEFVIDRYKVFDEVVKSRIGELHVREGGDIRAMRE